MGDMGDMYREMRDHRADQRRKLGRECPQCGDVRPLANASILLPGQRCRVDGYVDPRPQSKGR